MIEGGMCVGRENTRSVPRLLQNYSTVSNLLEPAARSQRPFEDGEQPRLLTAVIALSMIVFLLSGTIIHAAKNRPNSPAVDNCCPLPYGWPGFPNYLPHCQEDSVDLTLENTDNDTLFYTIEIIEDPSLYSGWLDTADFSGVIPPGVNNSETGQVIVNAGGLICEPGTVVNVTGRVQFVINGGDPENFEVDLFVADTVILISYDTIATSCLALTVGNNGSAGNQGMGGVNMDYEALDWKEGMDSYLYDAGVVISDLIGTDTVVNWGLFQVGIADSLSLIPQGGQSKTSVGWAEKYSTGMYTTNDSSIAMTSDFYTPTHADSCNIIIKVTTVWSNDGGNHRVSVGEVADYDITGDSSNSYNTSGDGSDPVFASLGAQLIFLQGVDFPGVDPHDTLESNNGGWPADERYGILQYLGGHRRSGGVDSPDFPNAHGLYSASNPVFVYPYTLGFDGAELYTNMSRSGSNLSDSVQDLHVGISYVHEYDLAAGDSIIFCMAYITNLSAVYPYSAKASSGIAGSVEKAIRLYQDHFASPLPLCCDLAGDFNDDGVIDIADLSGPTSLVAYMFLGGPAPPCWSQADFNGDGSQDISDLSGPTSMVAYMFQGGPSPTCGPQDTSNGHNISKE